MTLKLESNRLILKEATLAEANELQNIYEEWDDKELLEGSKAEEGYIKNSILEGDLPPVDGASKDKYSLKAIYLRENNEIIGFVDSYFGYPQETTVWISIFVISKEYRKNGYAQEALSLIVQDYSKEGCKKIGIGVYLKNWRGLRFWTKAGFNKVIGVFGDKDYSDHTYAFIGLEKEIANQDK